MEKWKNKNNDFVSDLFRQEYTKITAVICRNFGLKYLEIAEDITGETFLKAIETWNSQGIPENPEAWLYKVAKNKAVNYLKRQTMSNSKIKDISKSNSI